MINLYNQVPSVYTSASRDFQYLSWLFNIVLNSVKHNIDGIYNLPNVTGDPKLTELLAMTLGFKIKRHYDQKQLTALVAILHSALRYKGTERAILMAAEALVKAMGSLGEAKVEVEGTEITVTLPEDLVDITLFLDVLDYILPAGMTCRVIRKSRNTKNIDDIQVRYSDTVRLLVEDDLTWVTEHDDDQSAKNSQSAGLSGLYEILDTEALRRNVLLRAEPSVDSANISSTYGSLNTANIRDNCTLNAGLLDNTIIPVLANNRAAEIDEATYTAVLYSTEPDGSVQPIQILGDENNAKTLMAKNTIQEL